MFYAVTVAITLILIVAAWKLLKGIVKTVALAAILIFAAVMVYGMIHR